MSSDSPANDPLITADSIGLSVDDAEVLRGINLDILEGEFVSLIGPSGCGKTSLLRMVAGLQEPSVGRLCIENKGSAANRIAYVFQEPNLLPWRDAMGNVALPLELSGVSKTEARERSESALNVVGLSRTDYRKRPHMLSGGMRMRVSLARAIVVKPGIMLFDEPFAALDDLLRMRLNEEILRLREGDGWTGLFVTHNIAEAVFLSRRVVMLMGQPATVVDVADVPFPYPREQSLRTTPEFNAIVQRLTDRLMGAM